MPDISALTGVSWTSLTNGQTITHTEHNTWRTGVQDRISDLNTVVADLEDNYASSSQPGDKPEGKLWCDNTNDPAILKYYKDGSSNLETLCGITLTQTLTNKTLGGYTLTGDVTSTGTAIDWDLVDNNASALSFDATGKAGILNIITTDSSEGVSMSGTLAVTGITTLSTDLNIYEAANDGNPQIRLGATDAEELHIQAVYDSAAQTLDYVLFQTDAASATADKGEFRFNVDGTEIGQINDSGINVVTGKAFYINDTSVLNSTTLGTGVTASSLTSVGTLTSLTMGGDINLSSNNITNGGNIAGTLTTAAQANITSLGTLTSLTISGDLTVDTTTLYVDSTKGVVGVGKTSLESWHSTVTALQVGGSATLWCETAEGAGSSMNLSNNAYYDSGGTWKYIVTDEASNYYMKNGVHAWRVAASGTADTAITWTEAMQINANGSVSIGSSYNGSKLSVVDSVSPGSGSAGATLLIANTEGTDGNASRLLFGYTSLGNITSSISGIHSDRTNQSGHITFSTLHNGSDYERMRITSDGKISTGAETAPDVSAGGLCLNQGAEDGIILSFKSSDIAHGMTSIAETDTYLKMQKLSSTAGGNLMTGFSEDVRALEFFSYATNEDTTDTSSSTGAIRFRAAKKSGTTETTLGATANLFTISNGGTERFLLKGNGDIHATNTSITALDTEDDIQLVQDARYATAQDWKHKVSESGWNKLIELGILSSKGDFQNVQKMNALLLGATGQLWNMIRHMAEKLGLSESELKTFAKQY